MYIFVLEVSEVQMNVVCFMYLCVHNSDDFLVM
jgi:hypothetical protein